LVRRPGSLRCDGWKMFAFRIAEAELPMVPLQNP
jgi:hypothetical protein